MNLPGNYQDNRNVFWFGSIFYNLITFIHALTQV
jgi:hypothetical protein